MREGGRGERRENEATQSPSHSSVELDVASGLVHPQPRPGHQFTVLLEPG